MKAVILADEKGTELRPVTCAIPKAMAKIMNRPCISYVLELLSLNGIEEGIVALEQNGQVLSDWLGANPSDMEIRTLFTRTPLGSAGAVKACGEFLDEDFLVINGGCICDFDLSEAIEFHKAKGGLITVITALSDSPTEYGNIFSDRNKKIQRIYEKPGWEQVTGNKVNTEIYICQKELLSYIPDGSFSFSTQLIPLLLEKGLSLYEFSIKGYWCDISTIEAYRKCNFDMLSGKIATVPFANRRGRRPFKTSSPVYIGRGVTADPSAHIGPNAIVGDGCFIGKDAVVKDCIIGNDTVIGDGCIVSGIVGDNAVLRPQAQTDKTAVIGNNCVIGRKSRICKNTRVFPDKEIGDGMEVSVSLLGEDKGVWLFGERSIEGDMTTKMTPLFASRLGGAIGECFAGDIMVGCNSFSAKIFANSLSCALTAKGAHVLKSQCSINELRYAAAKNMCPCVFVHGEGNRIRVFIYEAGGTPINYILERKIQNGFFEDNKPFSSFDELKEPDTITGTAHAYCRDLEKLIGKTAKKVLIYGESELCTLFRRCVNHAGGGLSDDMEFEFDENGIDIKVTEDGFCADRHILTAILCLFEGKRELPLPLDTPAFLLDRIGVVNSKTAENAYGRYPYFYDSLFLAGRLLNIMEHTGKNLKELYSLLPKYGFVQSEVRNRPRAAVIAFLKELIPAADTTGRGICITADNGVINIIPLRRAEGFKVQAFSADTETSRELCMDMCDILKSIDIN